METSNAIEKNVIDLFPVRGMKAKMFLPDRNVDYNQSRVDIYNTHRELDAIMSYIPDHPYVVDVGANIGSTVLWWMQRVFPRKITAFEPCGYSYRILQKNIELNDFADRVEAVNACVGAMDGRAIQTFHSVQHTGLAKFAPHTGTASSSVPMVALDTFILDKDRVDVLKIDVEGSELDVLRGAEKTISIDKPLIFIEIWRPYSHKRFTAKDALPRNDNYYAVIEKLNNLGYTRWLAVEGDNFLFIPREKAWEYDQITHPKVVHTFYEKIRYIARHGYDPLMTRLADKYRVREWVANKIGEQYLPSIYGVWSSAWDIDFGALPKKFILKTNHGSHYNIFVQDKSNIDIRAVRDKINGLLDRNFFSLHGELQYRDVKRLVFAEEYLEADPKYSDFKFFCFKGKCVYVAVGNAMRSNYCHVTRDWTVLPINLSTIRCSDIAPARPKNFDEMVHVAETLSEGFQFVRVDLLRLQDGTIRFGEMTFTPGAGKEHISPKNYELQFGGLFDCTPDNRIHG